MSAYQPPFHTTWPRLSTALKKIKKVFKGHTKHIQLTNRSQRLDGMLYRTQIDLEVLSQHHLRPQPVSGRPTPPHHQMDKYDISSPSSSILDL